MTTGNTATASMTIDQRLDRIEQMLESLISKETVKDFYTTDEFGKLIGKSEFTVREHCRLGRLHGQKRQSGRGPHAAWVVSHQELQRYRREGLIPLQKQSGRCG